MNKFNCGHPLPRRPLPFTDPRPAPSRCCPHSLASWCCGSLPRRGGGGGGQRKGMEDVVWEMHHSTLCDRRSREVTGCSLVLSEGPASISIPAGRGGAGRRMRFPRSFISSSPIISTCPDRAWCGKLHCHHGKAWRDAVLSADLIVLLFSRGKFEINCHKPLFGGG